MNINNILSTLSDANIPPEKIFSLVEEIKNLNLNDEGNIRKVIKNISSLSGRRIDKNLEDQLVKRVMNDGIPDDLLNIF